MIYSNPPDKVRIQGLADIGQVNKLVCLFQRHGYDLAEYGQDAVKFFSTVNQREDGGVPISDWYCLPKHEFAVFVSLINKLDTKAEDLRKYQFFVAQNL